MLEIVDPLKRPLHNFMLNACYTNQFKDNNNNIKFIVEATKSEKIVLFVRRKKCVGEQKYLARNAKFATLLSSEFSRRAFRISNVTSLRP